MFLENDIIKWTNGTKLSKNKEVSIKKFSTDTRTIQAGDLFVPIKGEKFDGNDFIKTALKNGAAGCITERDIDISEYSTPEYKDKLIIKVSDTNQAYLDMAEKYREKFNVKVVAVTGSVGKTITKDMIYSVLSKQYKVLKSEGNFNNNVGLPQTIFQLDDTYEIIILEMGMNNLGEIEKLSKVAKPNVAVITNIGDSHIGNLGSREGILEAKSEILKYTKRDGIIVLNGDDDYLRRIIDDRKILYCGFGKNNDCKAESAELINNEYMKNVIKYDNEKIEIKVNTVLSYITYPVMIATSVGKIFNISTTNIVSGIESFITPKRRFDIIKTKRNITLIDDCYNASLISMKSAIETMLNMSKNKRKVVILGDILELGKFSEEKHRELGAFIKSKELNMVILVGQEVKYTYDELLGRKDVYYFSKKEEAYKFLDENIEEEDVVLVKASNGNKFIDIVEYLK